MFRRNNIDDFDDYRKEQAEISRERALEGSGGANKQSKKPGNYRKNKKYKSIVETSDGVVYKRELNNIGSFYTVSFVLALLISAIIFASKGDYTGEFYNTDSFRSVVLLFGFIIVFIVISALASGKKAKSVALTSFAIVIDDGKNKISVPYENFLKLDFKRTYGRNHNYSGTRYMISYKDPNNNEIKSIGFPSRNTFAASDFYTRINEKRDLISGNDRVVTVLPARTFRWSEVLVKGNRVEKKFLALIPLLVVLVVGILVGSLSSDNLNKDLIPAFFLVFTLIVVSVFLVNTGEGFTTSYYPLELTYDEDSLRVDDLVFSGNEIREVYITPIGGTNPHAANNSTFYIVLKDGQYRYKTGFFNVKPEYRDRPAFQMPDWSYEQFYYSMKNWCKKNNVRCIDYIL